MARSLEELRVEIDRENQIILESFLRRMELAREVAEAKREIGKPIFDAARERAILATIAERTPIDYKRESRALFSRLMQLSREAQTRELDVARPLRTYFASIAEDSPELLPSYVNVACQGTAGAYSQKAAEKIFDCPQIRFYPEFESTFEALERGEVSYAVLPIENSTAGSVNRVYDLLQKHDCHIVKSYRMSIGHYLMAKQGVALSEITKILSHEQALNQCASTLRALCPNAHLVSVSNTAAAAKEVAESEERGVASLGSRECSELYGLSVLADHLHDAANNTTRFICISKKAQILPGADRVSLMLTLPHRAGALYEALSIVDGYGVSLEKLESRPLPGRDFEFKFYFDLRIPAVRHDLPDLLSALAGVSEDFRFLGAYSELV